MVGTTGLFVGALAFIGLVDVLGPGAAGVPPPPDAKPTLGPGIF